MNAPIRNHDIAELKRLDLAHHLPAQADHKVIAELGGSRIITRAEGCVIHDADGVALLDGRVFRGTCDGRLVALDAASGKLLWKNVIASQQLGESTPGVPLAWAGVVYMGIGGSDVGIRGRVMAYDAATGEMKWRFYTVPGDPKQAFEVAEQLKKLVKKLLTLSKGQT